MKCSLSYSILLVVEVVREFDSERLYIYLYIYMNPIVFRPTTLYSRNSRVCLLLCIIFVIFAFILLPLARKKILLSY